MNGHIIGGADGPTSIFLAGKTGPDWISIFGLGIVILMLLPNLVYAIHFRDQKNLCTNKGMNCLEQIGRYVSMFLMIFNIGIAALGFRSVGSFLLYGIGTIVLLIAYWFIWMLYFCKQDFWKSMALAIIPTGIFLLSGITRMDIPLIISAVLFGTGHIYVTYQNAKRR